MDFGEVAHRLRIDAALGRVEGETAERFEGRRFVFADQIGESRRFRPVILEDEAAHAAFLRKLGDLESIPLAGIGIRAVMRVYVDRPVEDRVF